MRKNYYITQYFNASNPSSSLHWGFFDLKSKKKYKIKILNGEYYLLGLHLVNGEINSVFDLTYHKSVNKITTNIAIEIIENNRTSVFSDLYFFIDASENLKAYTTDEIINMLKNE